MVSASRYKQQEQRLDALERRLGQARLVAWGALLVGLAGAWVGARLPDDPVLRAERLVLSDADGEGWIELGRVDGRPTILVRDARGRERIKQFVGEQGPAIGVLGAEDGWQGWLALSPAKPWLGLYDGAQKIRAEMGVDEAGPLVAVRDAHGGVIEELFDPDARAEHARRLEEERRRREAGAETPLEAGEGR